MTGANASASTIWFIAGWTMLHFLWIGSVVGVVAAAGRPLLRGARPEARYACGLAWLAVLALTPVVIASRLPGTPTAPARLDLVAAPTTIPGPPARAADAASGPDHDGSWSVPGRERPVERRELGTRLLAAVALRLPYLWLCGAPVTFLYLAFGLAGAERLRRRAVPVGDPRLCELGRSLAASLGVARRVALATCERVAAPVLVGIIRPAILLPCAALTGWSVDQLEMALLHELVHVRRRDNLVILVQRLVESILFFHPAAWIISGWVHRDREHCCDAVVVRHTGRPLAYAEALLALADAKPTRRPAAVAMAEGDLVARIRRLLDTEDPSMRLPSAAVALVAGLLLVPVVLLGAQAARARGGAEDPPNSGPANDAGKTEELRRVAAEVIEAIGTSDRKPSSDSLADIARARAKIGDRAGALEMLKEAARVAAEMKPSAVRNGNTISYGLPSAHHLCRVAEFQAELGDKPAALETLRMALRDEGDPENPIWGTTLARIAGELRALGARDEAVGLAWSTRKEYEADGGRRNDQRIVPQIAAMHVAAGDIDGAFDVLDRVADSDRPARIKQVIVGHSLGEIAKVVDPADRKTAREVLDRVLKRLDDVPLAEDKYFALTDIAHALARIGDFEGALRAARLIGEGPTREKYDMREGKPYVMALVAHEQHKAGDVAAARATLREARAACAVLGNHPGRTGRLWQVAGTMVVVGDLEGALACVEDMPATRRAETLANIAVAQQRAGDREAARATFRRALEDAEASRGHRPTPGVDMPKFARPDEPDDAQWDAQVAREVAKIRAMMGDFEAARKTADSIPDEVWRGFALADVARAQAAAGDARGALAWARDLKLPNTRPTPLEAIVAGIADSVGNEAAQSRPAPEARKP